MLNSNAISRISYSEVYIKFNNSDDVYCYENVSRELYENLSLDEFINNSEYFVIGIDE